MNGYPFPVVRAKLKSASSSIPLASPVAFPTRRVSQSMSSTRSRGLFDAAILLKYGARLYSRRVRRTARSCGCCYTRHERRTVRPLAIIDRPLQMVWEGSRAVCTRDRLNTTRQNDSPRWLVCSRVISSRFCGRTPESTIDPRQGRSCGAQSGSWLKVDSIIAHVGDIATRSSSLRCCFGDSS